MKRFLPVETSFRVEKETLVIDLGKRLAVLSSGPFRGGLVRARYLMNHQVAANPLRRGAIRATCKGCYPHPYLKRLAHDLGARGDAVALMTAVPLERLITLRAEAEDLWVEAFLTVGVTNAVRAGDPATAIAAVNGRAKPGTINLILVTNARLPAAAMIGAVQVMTEGKAAAVLAAGIRSREGTQATGTGTDAVIIACGAGPEGPRLRYSGTHTKLGELTGRLIFEGVTAGLHRAGAVAKRRAQ